MESLNIVSSNNGIQWVPIAAMQKDGVAAAHHLNVKLTVFQAGSGSSSQIFAGGTGDILMSGIDAPVNFITKKALDVTVVGAIEKQNPFVLVSKAGSDIKDAAALSGQTLGVSGAGSFSDYSLRALLKENNIDPTKSKIAALGASPAQVAALLSGNAAAVMLQSPAYEDQLAAGKIQVVHNFREDPPVPAILALARTSDVKANATKFKNFLLAWQDELKKMNADPAYATSAATAYLGATSTPADTQLQLKAFLGGIWSLDAIFTQELYDNGKKLLVASGAYQEATFPTLAAMTQGFTTGE